MTTPAQPATGDPAPATGEPSQQPEPATEPAPTTQPATGDDWTSVFEGMSPADVKAKLDHARTWETRAKKNKKELDDLKAAQTPKDGEPSTDDLRQRAEAAEARAAELAYGNTVTRVAAQVGADAEALLDSGSFRDAVADELGDDFDDNDLKVAVTKVAKEYAKKARFAVRNGPTRSGGDITGGPAGIRQITEAELQRMTPEQIVDAQNKGQLNSLLGIT